MLTEQVESQHPPQGSKMLPLGMTEDDYSTLIHRYMDRLDALLHANEFIDAEKILRDMVDEVLAHRLRMEKHLLTEVTQAANFMLSFESKMRKLIEVPDLPQKGS